jgi:5'-deoxynucleotidase YfbR-like HD superfamily hydrolase
MELTTAKEVRTFMGKMIDPFNPDPDQITLVDIAHSLSNLCRWNGHTMKYYSVAEHSIFVQNMVQSREDKLAAMLHDASEAYISDVTRPVKHRLKNYFDVEFELMVVISRKFGFQFPLSTAVKEADEYALRWEWVNIVTAERVSTMTPREAKHAFLGIMDILTSNNAPENGNHCFVCKKLVPENEITPDKRHDEDQGGCGCYIR